jgi:hypothetical protein
MKNLRAGKLNSTRAWWPTYNKAVSFEIAGTFNPSIWRGRNALEPQPIGETVITGHNRVVLERDQMFSTYFLKYINQNYANFIVKSVQFFT